MIKADILERTEVLKEKVNEVSSAKSLTDQEVREFLQDFNSAANFKLIESKMSANWIVGKVDGVVIGRDGYVREVTIAYKDTSSDGPEDWKHRTVDRPVRNVGVVPWSRPAGSAWG